MSSVFADLRGRDAAILVAISVSIFLTLQDPAAVVTLSRQWSLRVEVPDDELMPRNKLLPVPAPLLTDLDGDGKNEMVVVDGHGLISLYSFRAGEPIKLKTAVLQRNILRVGGSRPVALSAGYLDPYEPGRRRTKVIAVVREDLLVTCFDSSLRMMWARHTGHLDRLGAEAGNYAVAEVALLVAPLGWQSSTNPPHLHSEDDGQHSGAIIVGGSFRKVQSPMSFMEEVEDGNEGDIDASEARRREAERFTLHALHGQGGWVLWSQEEVVLESAGEVSEEEEISQQHPQGVLDALLHEAELRPQYKVPSADLYGPLTAGGHRRRRDQGWKAYTSALLGELPHSWSSPADTRLSVSHFQRQPQGQMAAENERRRKRESRKRRRRGGILSSLVEVPFTAKLPHDELEHLQHPNVVIAHTESGVMVSSLASGHLLFSVPMPAAPPSLWADIDGDGVVEHVHVVDKPIGNPSQIGSLPACSVLVSRGIPPAGVAFNASLCHSGGAHVPAPLSASSAPARRRSASRAKNPSSVSAADPILLPGLPQDASSEPMPALVFAVNTGVVTQYSGDGKLIWQTRSGPAWSQQGQGYISILPLGGRSETFDESRSFSQRFLKSAFAESTSILVMGEEEMQVYSTGGGLEGSAKLLQAPRGHPVIADFDGDGWDDVVVFGPQSITGYRVQIQLGGLLLLWLVLIMMGAIVVMHVALAGVVKSTPLSGSLGQKKRSTD